ncbi:MAG: serine kinase [Marinilabiliales bacterium]|nr:MAG: serine kinase [Marinilabiliales bacterium]
MTVADIVKELGLKVFSGEENLDGKVTGGYVSDLLSDVMGNAAEGMVWITLQTHRNVTAVASLKDLAAIILVKGLVPDDDMAGQAAMEGIPVLGTGMQAFDVAGKLHNLLNRE